jgi:predicted membrane channel-forming protein YqfA (hemolysin III family)
MSNILYTEARWVSYEEKGQWVYLIVTAVTYVAYLAVVIGQAGGGPLTEVDYVPILLWTIGAAIVASIVGHIVIAIARPNEPHTADVRDRDIGRRGDYVGGTILGIGMLIPFLLAITEADHFWIANAMYLVFAMAALAGTVIKLVAYRRGL